MSDKQFLEKLLTPEQIFMLYTDGQNGFGKPSILPAYRELIAAVGQCAAAEATMCAAHAAMGIDDDRMGVERASKQRVYELKAQARDAILLKFRHCFANGHAPESNDQLREGMKKFFGALKYYGMLKHYGIETDQLYTHGSDDYFLGSDALSKRITQDIDAAVERAIIRHSPGVMSRR